MNGVARAVIVNVTIVLLVFTASYILHMSDFHSQSESFLYTEFLAAALVLVVILFAINLKSHLNAQRASEKSRLQLMLIAENIPGIFFQFHAQKNGDRIVNFVCGQGDKHFGVREGDNLLEKIISMTPPGHAEGLIKSLEDAVENTREWAYEGKITPPSGPPRWFSVRARPEQKDGAVVFTGVMLDITHVKQTEDLLRESEAKYWSLFDMANDSIFLLENGFFVKCNKKTEELFGCEKSYFAGKTPADFSPPLQPDKTPSKDKAEELLKNAERGIPQFFQWRHLKFNGAPVDVEISLSRVEFEGHVYIQAILRDITRRKRTEEELVKNEERLRLALEATSDAVWEWDIVTGKAYLSPRWFSMLGYNPAQFEHSADTWRSLVHPDDLKAVEPQITRAWKDGTNCEIEYRMRASDGSWKWICGRGKVSKWDDNGRPVKMSGANTDITDRKTAENALRESEENLRITLNSIADAVIATDNKGAVSRMNPMAEILTGWTEKMAVGRDISEVFKIVSGDTPLENPVARALRTGKRTSFDSHSSLVDKVGARRKISESASPLKNTRGETVGVVLVFRDVSIESALQEKLKASEETFRTIFETSPYGISITRMDDWKIIAVNPTYEKLTGYTQSEILGRTLDSLEMIPDDNTLQNLRKTLKERGRVENTQLQIRKKNHAEKDILFSSVAVRFQDMPCVVTMFADMSRQVQIEDQLRHSQKMDVLGHLAGGIAHDFNNMLAVITGTAELLQSKFEKNSPLTAYTQSIIEASKHSSELTRNLLTFSRKGKQMSVPSDMHEIIRACVNLMGRSFDRKIKIVTKFNASIHTLVADPVLIQNALMNLALNARDAMPEGGTITFATSNITLKDDFLKAHPDTLPGKHILVEVRDTGVGMTKDVLRHIFEPFFTTKEVGKGTGLGLSAVYGSVNEHKGAIEVESRPGRGSCFKIYLPAAKITVNRNSVEDFHPVRGNGLILSVDDEPGIRNMTKDLLCSLGYEVLLAEDGEEAVKIYKENHGRIDLVLMDIIMPKMNGKDAFLEIRKIDQHAKVIFASGYTREEGVHELFNLGAEAFIEKPYHLNDLSRLISETIGKEKLRSHHKAETV